MSYFQPFLTGAKHHSTQITIISYVIGLADTDFESTATA
ncbi:hypothetical protein Sarmat_00218 [Rickettsiales endosymbiont of Paramecium tredecaurelia]|nr:hypothetical protein [Candidatus Sarmatiella mevalonica]